MEGLNGGSIELNGGFSIVTFDDRSVNTCYIGHFCNNENNKLQDCFGGCTTVSFFNRCYKYLHYVYVIM